MKNSLKGSIMIRLLTIIFLFVFSLSGCAYFNTFYLAQRNFKDAERQRIRDNGEISSDTKKKYNEAINWGREVSEEHRDSRYIDDSLYIIGKSYYYINDFVWARNVFGMLVKSFPESKYTEEAIYFKARSLLKLNQYDEARVDLQNLMINGSRNMKGRAGIALAEIAFVDEHWDELLNAAQAVIDSDPEKTELAQAIVYKGEALYQLKRYDECITTLEVLEDFKLIPESKFRTNSLIALCKGEQGNYDEALTYLSSLQNIGEFIPFDPKIRLEIGKIYELEGKTDLAIDTYKKMAGDYPDSLAAKEAWYRVGSLLLNDLSNVKDAKDAFEMVKKGKARSTEFWVIDASIKSSQIDSMVVWLGRIDKLRDNPESQAHLQFSLAELYMYSFNRPDSALTQYRNIIETAPQTEYAVMSDFFILKQELVSSENFSEESEHEIMKEIIEKYPDSEFSQELKVNLGMIDVPPDIEALLKAEKIKMSGQSADVYIPMYQAVVDSFPNTKSGYQARFVIAYSYEHDVGDMDKALELYNELASETPSFFSQEYVTIAREKLEYYAEEPKMLEEIRRYLAGAGFTDENSGSDSTYQAVSASSGSDSEYTSFRKIRERNARIRSRYFKN